MKFKFIILSFILNSCAILHHVQIGSIDNTLNADEVAIPFDIKVSELGFSAEEAGRLTNNDRLAALIAMFQVGPRTGNPVYDEKYAEKIAYEVYQKCPNGKIVNLVSIREMRKYPVISGEIVKVTGECINKKIKGI